MKAPVNEMLVTDIAGRVAVVVTELTAAADVLKQLGIARQSDRWERAIEDDHDRQALVAALIDLDALFSAGRDWSPQALVEYYREIGVVRSVYRSVAWRGPSQYVVERHD
ncbi:MULTISPECIES: hypothetical protein [Burkholderia]|uniref:hypothetical protein n=1 Tax=Burkholderia TaxID=32008 RepID=UPI00075C898B|nr:MULTISPECIES: hypothetical protein [Burkholderia]KVF57964.1 hypothetical protein WJ14_14810 [Burkholderia cenocepacia]MBG0863289.1 hypothetical protein [Burkholderia sp. 9779_493]MCW3505869.1 hypothetical protein [Burkholderia cenocepacia]MCW3513460.1 hypothetical protein [Burkholderia cenocepacia]MCW3521011.1 hypothetical protein [Burkholderia cenocepacia]